jgi:hypothetical protein
MIVSSLWINFEVLWRASRILTESESHISLGTIVLFSDHIVKVVSNCYNSHIILISMKDKTLLDKHI